MFLIVMTAVCLTVSLGSAAVAENRIYFDYSKEESESDGEPRIGFDWNLNDTWMISAGYQFEGGEENETAVFSGITAFVKDYNFAVRYETSDSQDMFRVQAGVAHKYSDALRTKGRITFSQYQYSVDFSSDYDEFVVSGGIRYQINDVWRTSFDCVWENTDYQEAAETDESQLDLATRLTYKIGKDVRITGGVVFSGETDEAYQMNWSGWSVNYVISFEYTIGKFSFYVENQFLEDGDEMAFVCSYYF